MKQLGLTADVPQPDDATDQTDEEETEDAEEQSA